MVYSEGWFITPSSDATVRFRIQPLDDPSATLLSGIAVRVGRGTWQVTLDPDFARTLALGTYRFEAAANGDGSFVVVFAEQAFHVVSEDMMSGPLSLADVIARERSAGASPKEVAG